MRIADLHIHSKYSYATSRDGDAPHLDLWARRKGISLLGAGDCTHQGWRAELQDMLRPAEDGLYVLREDLALPDGPAGENPRFIITGEISSIYKKGGKTRRVHNIVLFPSLADAEALSRKLEKIGNIHADGRPILKLDCRDLVEMTLDACPRAMIIPAHIWTPHFSVFGTFSGFETMEECFGDLTDHIHALETGLSSDPAMNGRLSMLDRYTMVSNSDAHSPAKLGREANLLDIDLSYDALADALSGRNPTGFCGTIEFFPEEGKYHLDGHRACGVCLSPDETLAHGGRCPVCGGKLTIGVLHRLEALADRPPEAARHRPFESLTPLPDVLASCMGAPASGVRVQREYLRLVHTLGPELFILREASLSDVALAAGEQVGEGLRRLRAGEVIRRAGFDGQYGVIDLFSPAEIGAQSTQVSLFGASASQDTALSPPPVQPDGLDDRQRAAVHTTARAAAVIGGAGTGKTEVFAARIAHMIGTLGIRPSHILAVTPTNEAAFTLKTRLAQLLGSGRAVSRLTAGTFHTIAQARRAKLAHDRALLAPDACYALAAQAVRETGFPGTPSAFLQAVSMLKNGADEQTAGLLLAHAAVYDWKLRVANAIDADDLLLDELEASLAPSRGRGKPVHVLVDGFDAANDSQYRLARAWSAHGTLFVTADPSICRVPCGVLSRLRADNDALHKVNLVQNYRNTPEILHCAQAVLAADADSAPEAVCPRDAGGKVRLVRARGARDEAGFVARDIAAQTHGAKPRKIGSPALRSFGEIAVLCRTHRQLALLERTLNRAGIPCAVKGLGSTLQATCVHGVLSLLRFLRDTENMFFLRAYLRSIWKLSARRMDHLARLLAEAPPGSTPEQALAHAENMATDPAIRQALHEINALYPLYVRGRPTAFLTEWATRHALTKDADLSRLINLSASYRQIHALLDDLCLNTADVLHCTPAGKADTDVVTLATLHNAQHLSWDVVYLCGLTRGCVPLEEGEHKPDLHAERGLLYQGMTRAQNTLILVSQEVPSPWLSDLPAACIKEEHASGARCTGTGVQLCLF